MLQDVVISTSDIGSLTTASRDHPELSVFEPYSGVQFHILPPDGTSGCCNSLPQAYWTVRNVSDRLFMSTGA
jgi:hypothetical protein